MELVFLFQDKIMLEKLIDLRLTKNSKTIVKPLSSIYPIWTVNNSEIKVFSFSKNNELLMHLAGNNLIIFNDESLNSIICGSNIWRKNFNPKWWTKEEMLNFFGWVLQTGTVKLNGSQNY